MSSTTVKNLILSQPKSGFQSAVPVALPLKNEISSDDSNTTIKVEIPGVDPSTVDVECENNVIRVKCERGEFTHTVEPTIDTSKIKASIQWGLLTLTIPSPPPPASHSIKVNIYDAVKTAPSKAPAKFTKED